LSGRLVVPTSAAYLCYGSGDHVGLHLDLHKCELVLLTSVTGNLRPLQLHPELMNRTRRELVALAVETGGEPMGGVPAPSARLGATVLNGARVPHRRPRCAANEAGVVTALCYQNLF
jgi:hypothetical protein